MESKCTHCNEITDTRDLIDTVDGEICTWCLEDIKGSDPTYWFMLVSA